MKQNKSLIFGIAAALLSVFTFMAYSLPASAADEKIEQQRADIRKMADDTLERLYKTQPSAEKAIKKAAGYAVFSNFGLKIFFAGGGSGKGIAVNNKSKKDTYMKMIEVQAGLGMGVKKFRLIWVFDNQVKSNPISVATFPAPTDKSPTALPNGMDLHGLCSGPGCQYPSTTGPERLGISPYPDRMFLSQVISPPQAA